MSQAGHRNYYLATTDGNAIEIPSDEAFGPIRHVKADGLEFSLTNTLSDECMIEVQNLAEYNNTAIVNPTKMATKFFPL